jgi:hypothetical protein
MKIDELATRVGKGVPYVLALRRRFGLPSCHDYPEGYATLVAKLFFLEICSVPEAQVKALLSRERKLLELLRVDSLHEHAGRLWFESLCTMKSGPTRLLLSGHDLGHSVDHDAVQPELDFSRRGKELFRPVEMGADALCELRRYSEALDAVRERIRVELPVVKEAVDWAERLSF